MQKVVLALKKLISTSERRAEHLLAGQNTQHILVQSEAQNCSIPIKA